MFLTEQDFWSKMENLDLSTPVFLRETGYRENELLGADALDLVYPKDRKAIREKAIKIFVLNTWISDIATKLKSPNADVIAWPRIAGYNDHSLEKGKTLLFKGASLQPEAPEASTQQVWLSYQNIS